MYLRTFTFEHGEAGDVDSGTLDEEKGEKAPPRSSVQQL